MGALSYDSIKTSNFLGVDPTMVPLSRQDMMYNVQLNYYVTSQVKTNVGFFGGLSLNPMFGPETSFLIQSLDPQCGYSMIAPLSAKTSSWTMSLAAMNYSVTLVPNSVPAPVYAGANIYCDKSLSPYAFMDTSSQLSQSLYTDLTLPSTDLNATFLYRSGLCMEVIGAENFLHSLPKPDSDGLVCFANDYTMLKKGQRWNLSISLFELYPSASASWVAATSPINIGTSSIKDKLITDATVEILDAVSGFNSPQSFVYSSKHFTDALNASDIPATLAYTISAGNPNPSSPYALSFNTYAKRVGPEGSSKVS
jgi:hypothetical protein